MKNITLLLCIIFLLMKLIGITSCSDPQFSDKQHSVEDSRWDNELWKLLLEDPLFIQFKDFLDVNKNKEQILKIYKNDLIISPKDSLENYFKNISQKMGDNNRQLKQKYSNYSRIYLDSLIMSYNIRSKCCVGHDDYGDFILIGEILVVGDCANVASKFDAMVYMWDSWGGIGICKYCEKCREQFGVSREDQICNALGQHIDPYEYNLLKTVRYDFGIYGCNAALRVAETLRWSGSVLTVTHFYNLFYRFYFMDIYDMSPCPACPCYSNPDISDHFPGAGGGVSGSDDFDFDIDASGECPNPWNEETHHRIIDSLASKTNLSETELDSLKIMSDWCDKLIRQKPKSAYYHAMSTASGISKQEAEAKFVDHLADHLTSYIVNRDIKSLGIAFHGIADSFCPGHMGFQYYALNPSNMYEHSRLDNGDHALVIVDRTVNFLANFYNILRQVNPDSVFNMIEFWKQEYLNNLNNF